MEFLGKIYDEFKEHTALALIFFGIGAIGVSFLYYVIYANLHLFDIVPHDSYIYRSVIEKTYVPIEQHEALKNEMKSLRINIENLIKQNTILQQSQSVMSTSVCQRFAYEADGIVNRQRKAEDDIQSLLSPTEWRGVAKSEIQMQADEKRAQELRQYSQQLDRQLFQVRSEIAKCNK